MASSSTDIMGCIVEEQPLPQFVQDAIQEAVQEFTTAMHTPPRGKRAKNKQIREALNTVSRGLIRCAELMEPSIVALAATRPTIPELKGLSRNGYDTCNNGVVKLDYGNWSYTTLLKAVEMISPTIRAAIVQMIENHHATTLCMRHDDTEDALVNQGNVVETCLAQLFPKKGDPMYDVWRLRWMKDQIIEVSTAIEVIYQVSRGSHRTQKNAVIEKHTLNLNNIAICKCSTEGFAAVIVALARDARA